jgi:flagellar assembly protein FliH
MKSGRYGSKKSSARKIRWLGPQARCSSTAELPCPFLNESAWRLRSDTMAGIIKAGVKREDRIDPRIAVFNLDDLSHKAQRYLDQFRAEAAKILQAAHIQADQIRQKAIEEGRLQARKDAEKNLEAELKRRSEAALATLETITEQVETRRAEWQHHWESYAIKLSSGIAERVIRRELKSDPSITIEWIREALEMGASSGQVSVKLNPADIRLLDPMLEDLTRRLGRAANTTIVADDRMPIGEVRVETEYGALDQRITLQLERLEKELLGE